MSLRVYRIIGVVLVSGLFLLGLMSASIGGPHDETQPAEKTDAPRVGKAKATFAGGCFWCMEPPFDKVEGVISTTSGYTGGPEKNPTYKQVASGKTGHAEAVHVEYDANIVSYAELLEVFWRNIDPTTGDRQFCDWGKQYRTGIFYHNDEQKQLAETSKAALIEAKQVTPILTEIVAASVFYEAESYHQDYYKKNPNRYKEYRFNCGRDQRLRKLWGAADMESK